MPAGRIIKGEMNLKRILGLFVGISHYEDERVHEIKAAEDAKKLYEEWGNHKRKSKKIKDLMAKTHHLPRLFQDLKDVQNDQSGLEFLLLTSPRNEESFPANRVNIFAGLSHFHSIAEKGDLFIIFLSGQGDKQLNEFTFYPTDVLIERSHQVDKPDKTYGTGIVLNELLKSLSFTAKKGAKVLLIADACHAGAVSFDISEYSGISGGGISCLFSSSGTEYAGEDRAGGTFSAALVEALKGAADNDGKGYITLRDLYDHAYEYVTKNSPVRQHPLLIGTLEGNTVVKTLKKQE